MVAEKLKTLREIERILTQNLSTFRGQYPIQKLGIFGSYVRGEQTKESDLDILVEFDPDFKLGLLKFCHLENSLSDLVGIKVDLVMSDSLKPKIGQRILSEVVYL